MTVEWAWWLLMDRAWHLQLSWWRWQAGAFQEFPRISLQWRHNGRDIASQITSLTIVYSTVYSDADQRIHQSSASLAFVRGIHRGPVNSPHKWPVTRKMFPFDDVIMLCCGEATWGAGDAQLWTIMRCVSSNQLIRRYMMTSSSENIFRVTGPLWGEFTGHRWIPLTKASNAELWCFLDLRLNKGMGKQPKYRWIETPSRLLWCHCNVYHLICVKGSSFSEFRIDASYLTDPWSIDAELLMFYWQYSCHTALSLLEATCAKTSWRALLFCRALLIGTSRYIALFADY